MTFGGLPFRWTHRTWWAIGPLLPSGASVHALHARGARIAPDRQYQSWLLARAHYLEDVDSATEWQKAVAGANSERQEPLFLVRLGSALATNLRSPRRERRLRAAMAGLANRIHS